MNMNVHKRVLGPLELAYTVSFQTIDGRRYIAAASEGHGPALLFSPPDWKPLVISDCPGGVMCLEHIPGKSNTLIGVERFYPIFIAEHAGIMIMYPLSDGKETWRVRRVLDLPFVHRIRVIAVGGISFLVAATICGGKSFKEDWSKPGAIYISKIPDNPEEQWRLQPIISGLFQNHGLILQEIDDSQFLYIGCRNGLLRVRIPSGSEGPWEAETVLDTPVSDLSFFDLDGDGHLELATIEPFHGNLLVIYRSEKGVWKPVFEAELAFGHVVWCGTLLGQPGVLAGSRKEREELSWYYSSGKDLNLREQFDIDTKIGPTQIDVIHEPGRELIVSANRTPGEIALYEVHPKHS
jgi:hypothetical protein